MFGPQLTHNLDGAGRGPFVLLAGAGLSLWHPASLPTWGEFNEVLLDEAKKRASRALRAGSEAEQAVNALTVDDVGSKALSSALVEILAGTAYFDVVRALDAKQVNEAHRAVARLVRRRVIAAVVTTNFDTLIERAIAEEGLVVDCYAEPFDYRREDHSGCPVFKIHGSASPKSTLIDTVGQKLRGLPSYVRAKLGQIFGEHRVLVLGYSGGDLEFGADYLALRCVPTVADWIWWVVRPEDQNTIDSRTKDLVSGRGKFVLLQQAEALEAIGAGPVDLEWNSTTRAAVLEDLRTRARRMYAKLGNLNTLALCMRLLSAAGKTRIAGEIWQHIAATIDRRKRQTVPVLGPAMRALAAEGHRLFGVDAQEEWACRQLKDIHERRSFASPHARGSEDALVRDVRSETLACLALGDSMVRRGKDEEAGVAMQRAMEGCEYLGDIGLLPGVYRLYGWRAVIWLQQLLRSGKRLRDVDEATLHQMISHEETALGYLKAAEAAGLVAGAIDVMDSAWIQADLLVELGEYDAALLCMERLEDRVGLGIHRETQVRIEALRGDIELRQGRKEQAMVRWNACLAGLAHGNPLLEAYVKHTIVGRIGFALEWRNAVLTHCDDILHDMERGVLPSDSRTDLIGTKGYFETVKRNLTGLGSEPIAPRFIQRLDFETDDSQRARWPEYYIRQDLIYAEFHGELADVLGLLDQMVASHVRSLRGGRALDSAMAHLRRARKDGDDYQQFAALANVSSIRRWLGDRVEADAWYADALNHRYAKQPPVRSGLKRRLPHALWNTRAPALPSFPRRRELDLYDALAMKWTKPHTGDECEREAIRCFDDNDFVMGRLLALEAISAFREEGNPGGLQRGFDLLGSAAAGDLRSDRSPLHLCEKPIVFT
jgi:SIR2-like domain